MGRVSVRVLAHTPSPERAVAVSARLCYSPRDVSELADGLSDAEVEKLVGKIMSMGHFSTLEHAVFTFGIDGISRACSHQLVRHRVASYSQQSQRYVEMKKVNAIVPPLIDKDQKARAVFVKKIHEIWTLYEELVEYGIPAEDARYILPNACETKIVVTMNARELHHFFALRLCMRAQWEIREMAKQMYKAAHSVSPLLFKDAGPGCVRGKCTEGEYCCKHQKKVRAELKNLIALKS